MGEIYDTSYRPLKVVHAGNGYSADVHEFVLTRSGDALMTVQSLVNYHLPGTAPGKLSLLIDSIVQEVDVRTGLVVWEWHSLGHIPALRLLRQSCDQPVRRRVPRQLDRTGPRQPAVDLSARYVRDL